MWSSIKYCYYRQVLMGGYFVQKCDHGLKSDQDSPPLVYYSPVICQSPFTVPSISAGHTEALSYGLQWEDRRVSTMDSSVYEESQLILFVSLEIVS